MKLRIILIIILFFASVLRFYSLMHDSPYFFDPDERNMAIAVTQLRLPSSAGGIIGCLASEFSVNNWQFSTNNQRPVTDCSLDPRFFAYGQFPLYLAFASDQLTKPTVQLLNKQFITNQLTASQPAQADNQLLTTDFSAAVFWLRFWSALSSTFTVLLVYLITKELLSFQSINDGFSQKINLRESVPLLSAIISSFTPGLIQAAHFGTTESLLTFFFMASIYFSIKMLQIPLTKSLKQYLITNIKYIILISLSIGLALGSKLTGAFFLIPPFIFLLIRFYSIPVCKFKLWLKTLAGCIGIGITTLFGSIFVAIISSPYNLVSWNNFLGAVFGYERDVAMGKYEAFYTRQFVGSQPIIFQTQKIFPYTLGWPIFLLGILGFLLINFQLLTFLIFRIRKLAKSLKLKAKKQNLKFKAFNFPVELLVFSFSFLVFFIPNAFLFAKWTRFMTPVFPFFAIFAGYFLYKVFIFFACHSERNEVKSRNLSLRQLADASNHLKQVERSLHSPPAGGSVGMTKSILTFVLLLIITLPGIAFMSIYTHEDSRLTASRWIYQNIPNNSYILSETANVVDIPLGFPITNHSQPITPNYTVISFDFYHLDENPTLYPALLSHLERADYIFIPSRRLFANYPLIPEKYPLVTMYYQLLFSGRLGFEKVAEISSFPRLPIINYQFPDEQSEETYTVFDHPVIRIYRKTVQNTFDQYQRLFQKQ
jgi:4-amino-4-deoxy-L-arabinose transferase-like glycosyltransferase